VKKNEIEGIYSTLCVKHILQKENRYLKEIMIEVNGIASAFSNYSCSLKTLYSLNTILNKGQLEGRISVEFNGNHGL